MSAVHLLSEVLAD